MMAIGVGDDAGTGICQYRWRFLALFLRRSNLSLPITRGNSLLVLSVAIAFVLNIDASEKRPII